MTANKQFFKDGLKIFVLSIFDWPFYTGFTQTLHRFYTGFTVAHLVLGHWQASPLPQQPTFLICKHI